MLPYYLYSKMHHVRKNVASYLNSKMHYFRNIAVLTIAVSPSYFLLPEQYKNFMHKIIFMWKPFKQLYFSTLISQKKLDIPTQYSVFIPHKYTMDSISDTLSTGDNVSGGVRILYGEPGCGKSTYTISECNRLVEKGVLAGLVLCNECRNNDTETSDWLNKCIGYEILSYGNPLSTLFSHQPEKHTVFLFDQFDNLYRKCQDKEMLRVAIKSLAEDGEKHNSYIVVLCISDPAIAADMLLLNGGKKIRLIVDKPDQMRWSEAEVLKFVSDKKLTKNQTDACKKVGTPQFCKDVKEYKSDAELDEQVTVSQEAWRKGTDIVTSAVLQRR